jgi:hypothetical protein
LTHPHRSATVAASATSTLDAPESGRTLIAEFPDPIPGIIPFGTLTLVAGAAGVGKTAALADWIVRWRTGRTIWGKATNAPVGGFFYIAADRQWKSHQLWFDAVGYPDIPHYSLADDGQYPLEKLRAPQQAFSCFEDCLARVNPPPGAHLIVDPASPLFISGDPNKARDVAVSMLRFSRTCQKYQINITATAHFGKQKGDSKEQYQRPQDRIAGSGAFSGFSDTQIYLIDPIPPHQPYHMLGWVPRHAAPEDFKCTRNDQGLFVPFEDYTELATLEQVLEAVPYTPLSTEGIINTVHKLTTDLSVRTIERKLGELLRQSRIIKVRRGVYCRVKPS